MNNLDLQEQGIVFQGNKAVIDMGTLLDSEGNFRELNVTEKLDNVLFGLQAMLHAVPFFKNADMNQTAEKIYKFVKQAHEELEDLSNGSSNVNDAKLSEDKYDSILANIFDA